MVERCVELCMEAEKGVENLTNYCEKISISCGLIFHLVDNSCVSYLAIW